MDTFTINKGGEPRALGSFGDALFDVVISEAHSKGVFTVKIKRA